MTVTKDKTAKKSIIKPENLSEGEESPEHTLFAPPENPFQIAPVQQYYTPELYFPFAVPEPEVTHPGQSEYVRRIINFLDLHAEGALYYSGHIQILDDFLMVPEYADYEPDELVYSFFRTGDEEWMIRYDPYEGFMMDDDETISDLINGLDNIILTQPSPNPGNQVEGWQSVNVDIFTFHHTSPMPQFQYKSDDSSDDDDDDDSSSSDSSSDDSS